MIIWVNSANIYCDLRFGWLNVPGHQNVLCAKAPRWPSCLECFKYNCTVLGLNLAEELCHIPVSLLLFLITIYCQLSKCHKLNFNNEHSAFSTDSDCMVSVFKNNQQREVSFNSLMIHFTKVTDELAFLFTSEQAFLFLVFQLHDEIDSV